MGGGRMHACMHDRSGPGAQHWAPHIRCYRPRPGRRPRAAAAQEDREPFAPGRATTAGQTPRSCSSSLFPSGAGAATKVNVALERWDQRKVVASYAPWEYVERSGSMTTNLKQHPVLSVYLVSARLCAVCGLWCPSNVPQGGSGHDVREHLLHGLYAQHARGPPAAAHRDQSDRPRSQVPMFTLKSLRCRTLV